MKSRQGGNRVRDGHLRARGVREDAHHAKSAVLRGVLSVNSRAVGFISPEHGEDVMIETENLATALNRDEVEVEIIGRVKKVQLHRRPVRLNLSRITGKVVRIIKRAKMRFVGTIEEKTSLHAKDGGAPFAKGELGHRLVLVPDDFRMYAPIVLNSPIPKGLPVRLARERTRAGEGTQTGSTHQGEEFKSSVSSERDTSFYKGGIRTGYKALAEIKEWKPGKEPQGEIIKVIGKKGEHEVEMESIVLERGFESSFPREVEREAQEIAKTGPPFSDSEIRKRRDFRNILLFTIDPANAKDFDDAISFREIPNHKHQITSKKIYEVGVHIADVSHYVREGTALDREARERGTSVYLVDRTIPMLPHALSNDLCSLNPNVDRLSFSSVFEMDDNGHVYSRWFGKGVIHSQKRFTYETAQEFIDGHLPASGLQEDAHLAEILRTLNTIAKKLRAEKERAGAIDFEQDEVGFELDKNGHPLRVFKKKRMDTHKLIEELMLLANREVAQFFFQHWKKSGGKTQFIYRIHDVPDCEKLEQLGVFVRALGHELPLRKGRDVTGKDLQALFAAIEGHASESLIKTAAIRSMTKAVYSTQNIGHFGLAFEYYTHFTSPIRRYPDLLVHRSLSSILKNRVGTSVVFEDTVPGTLTALQRMAEDATQREIAAAEAERESIKLKQVEYMQDRLGKEFDGTISGVTEWGIYVEDRDTKSEGMVALRNMEDDYYVLDDENYRIVGDRTKKKYSLGDSVRFRVVGADIERKTLDYRLV